MKVEDLLFIAVGGAAATIARQIAEDAPAPMRTLILDTDDAVLQTLTPAAGLSATIFGAKRLAGRGTGGDRSLGSGALRDDAALVLSQIGTPRLAIVLTCCGGGTSGALPCLLEMLRNQGVATMTFATEPFAFEGADRRQCATVMLNAIASASDAFARVPLDSLLSEAQLSRPADEAFRAVAQRLAAGITLFGSLLAHPAFIAFDIERFLRLLSGSSGSGLPCTFADITCSGADRAEVALQALLSTPRFRPEGVDRLANATQVLVGVLAGDDLRLCELGTLMEGVREHCREAREVLLGTSRLAPAEGALSVVVIAFSLPGADIAEKPEVLLSEGGKKASKRKTARSTPQLGVVKDRFNDVEHTIYHGQDLDEPTYRRRGIRLNR